jgi:hypothetical protein
MSQDVQPSQSELLEQAAEHRFYKGNPHPYDEALPSFTAINAWEEEGSDGPPKLYCEFITVAPDPKMDEDTMAYKWRVIGEQINVLAADTLSGIFPRVKKLAEERARIAYVCAAQPTRDTMVLSASHAVSRNYEITGEQFLEIVGRSAFADPMLLATMLERSKCGSFQSLVERLK